MSQHLTGHFPLRTSLFVEQMLGFSGFLKSPLSAAFSDSVYLLLCEGRLSLSQQPSHRPSGTVSVECLPMPSTRPAPTGVPEREEIVLLCEVSIQARRPETPSPQLQPSPPSFLPESPLNMDAVGKAERDLACPSPGPPRLCRPGPVEPTLTQRKVSEEREMLAV